MSLRACFNARFSTSAASSSAFTGNASRNTSARGVVSSGLYRTRTGGSDRLRGFAPELSKRKRARTSVPAGRRTGSV